MSIELLIRIRPGESGQSRRLDETTITIGRDPTSVLRFDMAGDREVSTRHAEIYREDDMYVIADRDSTNGTWVNGARLRGSRRLHPGDVIKLGRSGPELRVASIDDDVWHRTVENAIRLPPIEEKRNWRQGTREYVVGMVETRTRSLRMGILAVLAGVIALGAVGWFYIEAPQFGEAELWSDVTAPSIRRANDGAIALIESEIPGLCNLGCEATGFGISPDGLLVTNRHVVRQQGKMARRIRVKFANTSVWVAATFVALSDDPAADIALIQLTPPGRYPSVVGVSAKGPDFEVGSGVLTIGFPLGTRLRMDGAGESAIASTTMTTGSIGKVLVDVFQIDAMADHGSSGSPVFDRHGHVIGIITGGVEDPSRKIVYVLPSNRIVELAAGR